MGGSVERRYSYSIHSFNSPNLKTARNAFLHSQMGFKSHMPKSDMQIAHSPQGLETACTMMNE